MANLLDIAEVAHLSGTPASTLRYYEEKGLIASVGRRGLRRLFGPDILQRLALIALGQAAGFKLDEIARMFAPGGQPDIDRQLLQAQADQLQRRIDRLAAMRDGLRHAAQCPETHHLNCAVFQRLLRAAALGMLAPGQAEAQPARSRS
ncbi:helix-turn-helix domain-containing protein [Bordetella trematum]|uniref:helix-turn-helix domain-containing protein n=1 Tax=Bordetella trematum TaxID=123899 RepID=UPI003AF3342B